MRLTDLTSMGYLPNFMADEGDCIQKLGKLEDIEELCEKVTKQPYYQKYLDGTISKVDDTDCTALYSFEENAIALIYAGEWYGSLKINEYGKTWALTRKELE